MLRAVYAFVDESARDGLYLTAAVLVPPERADDIRSSLRQVLRRGQLRPHWHDDDRGNRLATAGRIRGLTLGTVVVATCVEARKFERARRRCLVRLLWELDRQGVGEVVLESRGPGDAHDRRLIVAAQRTGQLSRELRYRFGRPFQECLLWLPDAVAGAVSAALCGDGDYLVALGDVTVIVV